MNTITNYQGIELGESLRIIESGFIGKIIEFEKMPDGMIVVLENQAGEKHSAYLHNCEFA